MIQWLIRGVISLGILVSSLLWFIGIEFLIAGIWLQTPALHQSGVKLVLIMAMVHLVLEIFPMRWAWHLLDRLLDRIWPLTPVLLLLGGCQPHEEPVPPTAPPPEDLST